MTTPPYLPETDIAGLRHWRELKRKALDNFRMGKPPYSYNQFAAAILISYP